MTAPVTDSRNNVEEARLAALRRSLILDTAPEGAFDDLAYLAAQICEMPIAAVSLLEEKHLWFKSILGIAASEVPREAAFCAHTVRQTGLFVVPDACIDERFAANPYVTDYPHFRFYAGAPLLTTQGHALGALCVLDHMPRQLTPAQEAALVILARQAGSQIELKRRAAALEQTQARLIEAQRIGRIGDWELDVATQRFTWSAEVYRLMEFDPADGIPAYEAILARYHPEDRLRRDHLFAQALATGALYQCDIRLILPSGTPRWCHLVGQPVLNEAGQVVRMVGTVLDITERALSEERFRVLFERSSEAHLLVAKGGILDCNPAAVALLGCRDKAELLALPPAALSPEYQPDGRRSDDALREHQKIVAAQGFHRFEWTHRRRDGKELPVEVTLTPVTLSDTPAVLVVWHDLTERKQAEKQVKDYSDVLEFQKQQLEAANRELATLATTDGLTGLKNHRAFQERLLEEVGRASRHGTPLSVVLLDVDHFKQYNDAFGHPEGDRVLCQVGRLLERSARDTDLAARYGGEEFVLILPQTDSIGAAAIAERLRRGIEAASWPNRSLTASFGVATFGPEADGGTLVAWADEALYHSKANGRNRVTQYPVSGLSRAPKSPRSSLLTARELCIRQTSSKRNE